MSTRNRRVAIRSALGSAALVLLTLLVAPREGSAAAPEAPVLTAPADGAAVLDLGPVLGWTNPPGTTQVHLQVIPYNGDGAGVDHHAGSPSTEFDIPAPRTWYGMLPGMTYTWRVRASNAPAFAGLDDPSWSPWAERKFKTPDAFSSGITPLMPAPDDTVWTPTPFLAWDNTQPEMFYYEVQLSKDPTFNMDPATATAMIYGGLRHGGVGRIQDSYEVPAAAPLEDKTTYYWRVRPRIQGDGKPVEWSTTSRFKTDFGAKPRLSAGPLSLGLDPADQNSCKVLGTADALPLKPDSVGYHYGFEYIGSGSILRTESRDGSPGASDSRNLAGPRGCYRSAWVSRLGATAANATPRPPGAYRVDIWAAGAHLNSGSLTLALPTAPAVGAITMGSAIATSRYCELSGGPATFGVGTATIYARYNHVLPKVMPVTITWFRGNDRLATVDLEGPSPAGCHMRSYTPTGRFTAGNYRVEVSVGGTILASQTFTVG